MPDQSAAEWAAEARERVADEDWLTWTMDDPETFEREGIRWRQVEGFVTEEEVGGETVETDHRVYLDSARESRPSRE